LPFAFCFSAGIALKEVRESRYWFRLLKKRVPPTEATDKLMQEAVELANILKSRIRNLHGDKE